MSDHHRGTRALLRISAKVSLRGCRSCGCFSTMPLASMVRTFVSMVDVSDAISLWALAGTPLIALDSAAYSQHARVPRAAGTDLWGTACFILRDVAVSVSMRRCVATRSEGEWMSSTHSNGCLTCAGSRAACVYAADGKPAFQRRTCGRGSNLLWKIPCCSRIRCGMRLLNRRVGYTWNT
jgi:hypothetical protein